MGNEDPAECILKRIRNKEGKAMTRKKARNLLLEMSRRIYLQQHGSLKGFGEVAKFYRDSWRHKDYKSTGGYKKAWNSEIMVALRKSVGM